MSLLNTTFVMSEGFYEDNVLHESEVLYEARRGVERQKVDALLHATGLTLTEMGQYVHVNPRTLQRKSASERLPSDISERVLLIQNLYFTGGQVFGSLEAFRQWMMQPNMALGGVVPKSYLDTFTGIEFLMHELGRIEHGLVA